MKKYYKIFVCPFVVVCWCIILLVSLVIFFWVFDDWQQIEWDVFLIVVGLPLVLFLWTFIAFGAKIIFSEIGIEKHLCGIPLKKYKWEDIQDIKIITTGVGAQWLFFSKSNLKNHGIDFCRLHPKTIYIAIDDKKLEKIKEFIPQDKAIREHKSKWLQ